MSTFSKRHGCSTMTSPTSVVSQPSFMDLKPVPVVAALVDLPYFLAPEPSVHGVMLAHLTPSALVR